MNPILPAGGTAQRPDQRANHEAVKKNGIREAFRRFSARTATAMGSPWAFLLASLAIVLWLVSGPMFGYSDTWQLVINTATTIVTFLMVFLIQNTQNRDARAIQLKLDELIKGNRSARNRLVDLEDCTEEELDELEREFKRVRERAGARGETGDESESPAGANAHQPHQKKKTRIEEQPRSA